MPDPRFGLLTQPGLLALLSHSDQTAPVMRGAFVRERILCDAVPPPPPNVNAIAPDPDPNATTRERFRQHTEQAVCSSCHQLIDGIGFGFERYDQLGHYRSLENGLDVDESGDVVAMQEEGLNGPFAGAGELGSTFARPPVGPSRGLGLIGGCAWCRAMAAVRGHPRGLLRSSSAVVSS